MVARDIPEGVGTTGRVRPDDFVRGVIDSPRDHDWYRVELDPGRYVFRLSGTGDHPVGDTLLVLRDEDGRVIDRNDNYYTDSGESRLEFEVTGERRDRLPRRQRHRPLRAPRRTGGARWRNRRLRPRRQPARRLAARRDRRQPVAREARHRRLLRAERQDRRRSSTAAAPSYPPAGTTTRFRRAMAALDTYSDVCDLRFRQTHQRAQADFDLLLNGTRGNTVRRRLPAPRNHRRRHRHLRRWPEGIFDDTGRTGPGGGLERGAPRLGADAPRVRPRPRARAPARRRLRLGGHGRDQAARRAAAPHDRATSA